EPAVERREKLACLMPLTLIAPEPRHTHRRAQFPGFCLLPPRPCECPIKIRLCLFWIRHERLECNFPSNAMHLGLAPSFLRNFYFVYRVVNATPRIVKLAKFCVSHCQIR